MKYPLLFVLNITLLAGALCGEDAEKPKEKPETAKATKGMLMDYGPFLSYSVKPSSLGAKKGVPVDVSVKGISIRVGKNREATVCFDADLMRISAGWTSGFLDLGKTNIGALKGTEPATIKGTPVFTNRHAPGWSTTDDLSDPRLNKWGPLSADRAHYKGLYIHGHKVVLSYSVGACEILESPDFESVNNEPVFLRYFNIGKSATALTLAVCEGEPNVWMAGQPAGATMVSDGGRKLLKIPAAATPASFVLGIGVTVPAAKAEDLQALTKGGAPHWPAIQTKGALGTQKGAYVLDTLTSPDENSFSAWMRFSGIDALADGRVVASTLNGDVWVVSGVDEKLENLSWKRFATGLYEPLGLKVVDDKIYVLGRDQITRLHDLNNDGEADFYENFNNSGVTHPVYHAFAFDLQTDKEGNFYYAKGGNQIEPEYPMDIHSAIIKISKDGSKTEPFALGFRAPNGMGIGPNDEVTCSDNQGHWMPASKISLIKKGGFYGHVVDPRKGKREQPASFEQPLCWMPQAIDNSSGGQVWVSSDKWGALKGHMLHMSYGKCALFNVMTQKIASGPGLQGGVAKFPIDFPTGVMRARFSAKDGQLYVAGLKGWQTSGPRDGGIYRVRYTGEPLYMPVDMKVTREGIQISFDVALDKSKAGDAGNYGVTQWNYKWMSEYASPELSLIDPTKKGRDDVKIESAEVSADGKSVFLKIAGLKPVMQMRIQGKIGAADGAAVNVDIYNTIHETP